MDLAVDAGDGAFENAVDVEGAGDFRQRSVCLLELHGGGAGNDQERRILGEHCRQFVGHAVGEVLLIRIAGEIVEGEDGERSNCSVIVSIEEAGSQRMRAEGDYRNSNEHKAAQGCDQPESVMGPDHRWYDGCYRDLRSGRRQVDLVPRRSGWLSDFWLNGRDRRDEPVTRAGDCLYELRQVGTIIKNLANFTNCRIDSLFDIDEDFPTPKALCNFIPSNNQSMFGDEQDEKFERLSLKLEPAAFAAKLKFAAVETEITELIDDSEHRLPPQRG